MCACILVHLLSDGETEWIVNHPPMKHVQDVLEMSFQTWSHDLEEVISITHRRLGSLISLVTTEVFACNWFALWEMTKMLKKDGKNTLVAIFHY